MTAETPSPMPTLGVIKSKLGGDVVPEWVAHIITSLEGTVGADVWLGQYSGDWNDIAAIRDAFDYAAAYRWMSRDDFVRKLHAPEAVLDVPQQRMERFIVVEVLKELAPQLDRAMVVSITRSLAANLLSHAFQRVSADYTWDRVVFDTIPFMIDFALKMLTTPSSSSAASAAVTATGAAAAAGGGGGGAAALPPPALVVSENSSKLYAWHLYIEIEGTAERLAAARAAATDLITARAGPSPLHQCCRGFGFTASDVAAVLVVEHRQNGDAARATDAAGDSVLHYAVQRRDDDAARLVRVLFSAGADPNARNSRGLTPLAAACAAAASARTVDELLGLDGVDVAVGDVRGLTALHYAVRVQRGNLVRALVGHGADPNGADRDGFTPAHVAASADSVSMLELLASLGASIEKASATGLTPLSVASRRHHLQAVLFLFQTRNHLAARVGGVARVRAVLCEQLPDLNRIPQVSISSLGLDHLPVEIGFLRRARRLDVRHNSLKTFWLTPWWWLPVFSRRTNSLLQVGFFLAWALFVTAAMLTSPPPSPPSSSSSLCPFSFRPVHLYVLALVVVAVVFLLCSLRSHFIAAADFIERRTARLAPFRPGRTANLLALAELFVEQLQLAALAHSAARPTPISRLFRAALLDFGPGPSRHLAAAVAIGLAYLVRVWVECRSFMPRIWAYDGRWLRPALVVLFPGVARALLATLLDDDMSHPASIVLVVFGVGAFLSTIPVGVFGEVALQARDGVRQVRTPPAALVAMRAAQLILVGVDVVLNQAGVPARRYHRLMACWLLPAAVIWTGLVGPRVLARDPAAQVRASTVWAAWLHAACLAAQPPAFADVDWFALISWPCTIVAVAVVVAVGRWNYKRRFAAQAAEARLQGQRDVLFQCFRLHPQYDDVARDFGRIGLDALERRYDLDRWLQGQYFALGGSVGPSSGLQRVTGVAALMARVQHDLPVNLPPL